MTRSQGAIEQGKGDGRRYGGCPDIFRNLLLLSLVLLAMSGSLPAEQPVSLQFIDGSYPEVLRAQFDNESSIIDGPLTLDCRVTLHDRSFLDTTLVEFGSSRNEFLLKFQRKNKNWWRIDIATEDGAKVLRTITCKDGFVDTEVNCWENKYWIQRHGVGSVTEPLHQKFNDETWPYFLLETHLLPGLNYLPSPDFAFRYGFLVQSEGPAESGLVQLMHGLRLDALYLATAKSIDDALQNRPKESGINLVRLSEDGWVSSVRNFLISQNKGPDGAVLDSLKDANVWNFLTDLKWGEDRVECSGVTLPISCDVSMDAVDFWSSQLVAGSVQRNEIPDTAFDRESADARPMISFYAREKPWYYKYWRRSVRYWKG